MSVTDTQRADGKASDELDEFDDESWLASTKPKGMRVRLPLAALTLGLALAIGVWSGAELQANQTPAASATGAFPTGGGGRGGGGFGGNGGGAGGNGGNE